MRKSLHALALAALVLGLFAVGCARAEKTCYPDRYTNIDCTPRIQPTGNQAPAAAQPSPSQHSLTDKLKRRLDAGQNRTQMNRAADQLQNAGSRLQSVTTRAAQTRDPQELARLRQEYEAARNDFRGAMRDLIAADPEDKADWEDQWRQQEAFANQQATRAGLFGSPAPAQPAAAVTAPASPAEPPKYFEKCDTADRTGLQICYQMPPAGLSCRKFFRQSGNDTPLEEQARCDRADLFEQRNKLFAKYPQGGAIAAGVPQPYRLSEAHEIRSLGQTEEEALLAQLPLQCVPKFRNYLNDVRSSQTSQNDEKAAVGEYGELDANPECRNAIQLIASAKGLTQPGRRLSPRASGALDAAMNADPSHLIATPWVTLEDTGSGYDVAEVMDFGFAILGIAAGAAGAYAGMRHGGGTGGSVGGGHRTTTYGQGSPAPAAPQTYHYGDGLHEGTAR